jgi:predicted O-linked N-acetylglucosamine transferase (SPINDLY family)
MTLSEALQQVVRLLNGGQADAAAALCTQILEVVPDNVDAIHFAGIAAAQRGDRKKAIELFRRALERQPGAAAIHNNLGNALREEKRYGEAAMSFERALEINPHLPDALNNLGIIFKVEHRLEEAVDCFRKALALSPDFADAHNNLGAVLTDMDRYEEASASFGRALELRPDFPEVYFSLGKSFGEQKRFVEAITCHQKVLDLDPGHDAAFAHLTKDLRHVCDWDGLGEREARFRAAVASGRTIFNPWFFLCLSDDPAEQFSCAKSYVEKGVEKHKPLTPITPDISETVIRIGYISNNFHMHPMSILLAEVFETHDRDLFEIHAFSIGPDQKDDMRHRFEQAFDKFHDVRSLSDLDVARKIRQAGITVLVDLMGFQSHCRPAILAYRPAPVQVAYMRHPGSTGAPYLDYALVDAFVAPENQQAFFSEKLVALPNTYQANQSESTVSDSAPSRGDYGLPDDAFVFCCFNNNYKISPIIFDVWMHLLRQIPDSVLWLFSDNPTAEHNLRKEATNRDIGPDRLVFASRCSHPDHLARHRLADLFLDTFPYGAHTTGSDALRMSLPMLTLSGKTFVSRVAGSLLHAAGLPELVTHSLEEYESLALKLARDPELLGSYRERLQQNKKSCPLFDCARFTRNLEAAFAKMVDAWRQGRPPEPFMVEEPEPHR